MTVLVSESMRPPKTVWALWGRRVSGGGQREGWIRTHADVAQLSSGQLGSRMIGARESRCGPLMGSTFVATDDVQLYAQDIELRENRRG